MAAPGWQPERGAGDSDSTLAECIRVREDRCPVWPGPLQYAGLVRL